MKYEYDEAMDETYQRSLVKSFKKTIDDDLFNFIIVDMINNKMSKIEEMSQYAKAKGGFQTYIIELNGQDEKVYFDRNVHNRSLDDIKKVFAIFLYFFYFFVKVFLNKYTIYKIMSEWEPLPSYYTKLDCSMFFQNHEIEQVKLLFRLNVNKPIFFNLNL